MLWLHLLHLISDGEPVVKGVTGAGFRKARPLPSDTEGSHADSVLGCAGLIDTLSGCFVDSQLGRVASVTSSILS